ncbi:MAG: hypothetical protein LBI60_06305, partial [Bacteroidales bacterium]|nr:hypothetical protein [Bacteroidales bacterium]
IVDKATQKDPAKRYQTCGDFRAALKNAIDPDKLPKMVKYGIAALALLLLGIVGWYWDYNRMKISYYKDYVEHWGVPVGIGKADYKHREKTYKFVYQYGKLQHLQLVNSKGNVVTDGESERFDRPINADFEYQEKDIAYVLYKNKNGKPFFRKRYNKKDGKINMFVFEYNDENGTDKRLPKNMTGYKRLEDEDEERGQISRFALEFDKNGYVTALHYRNQNGEAVGDGERIFGKHYERDSKGRVQKEYFLTNNDSVTSTSWGLGVKEFTYDNKDDLVKVTYLTPSGLPALDDKDGIAIYAMEYDDYGNLIYGWHKSSEDSLMLPKKFDVAGFYHIYSNNGENTETYYMGIDKKPMYSTKTGCIGAHYEYDEYGFVKKQTYIDENGDPMVASSGETYHEIVNDPNGNQLEYRMYDLEYKPFENINGFYKFIAEYDSLGNQVSVFYYGINDSLCITSGGYAGERYKWNDKNNLIEFTYYDTDNQPCETNGIYTVKKEYDSRGNELRRTFFAADGKTPVLNNDGIAGWEYKYDDNGNVTEIWNFDTNGKHISGSLNYAGYICAYDGNGYLEEIKNLDKNGNLKYVAGDGYARVKYINDRRGNHIEISYYDSGNRLIGTVERRVFNSHDDIIERTYFDANGNKVLSGGYHKLVSFYNERHQEIEARAYNTNEELVNVPSGYSIMKAKYNKQGLITEYATYNTFEKLVTSGGYALRRMEYDAMNRIIRETYFDEDSKPTNPAVQFPEILYGYDKWGNQNYKAYADGSGNLIDKENGSIRRTGYDIKGNEIEASVYDKTDKPALDATGVFKITYAYNKQNKVTEKRYYVVDGLRKNNYAIARQTWNGQGQLTEITYFNHLDQAVNMKNSQQIEIAHKFVYSYDEQGNYLYLKRYKVNGSLDATMKWNKQAEDWEFVTVADSTPTPVSSSIWRTSFQELAKKCPYSLSNEEGVEMMSITVTSNSCTVTKRYLEISKYSISNSDLEQKRSKERAWVQDLKKAANMPSNTTLTLIGIDKAERELFRINY